MKRSNLVRTAEYEGLWVLMNTRDDDVTLWKKMNSYWWAVCPPYSEPAHSDSFICPKDRAELEFYGA